MYFLLTRPEKDNRTLARELAALGHRVACAPLLTIRYYDHGEINLAPFQAIVFTSANGVDALAPTTPERDITCCVVGAATAQRAREAGFQTIFTAGGNVDRLAELIIRELQPEAGPLLHISGQDIAGNLAALICRAGFHLSRKRLYKAEKATRLSRHTHALISAGRISHIPLYSPRSAKNLGDLIRSAGLDDSLSRISALCLSPAVADMISSLPWREILIPNQPDQDSLFRLIKINLKENRQ